MTGTTQGPFSLPPGEGLRRGRIHVRDWDSTVLLVVAFLLLVILIASAVRSERAGVRELPGEQRSALFTRTVDELRQFCGDGRSSALDAHCRELAAFATQFDECKDECRALVRPHLAPRPTR